MGEPLRCNVATLFVEDLEELHARAAAPAEDLVVAGWCHPSAGLHLKYPRGTGVVSLYCAECGQRVSTLTVARRPKRAPRRC